MRQGTATPPAVGSREPQRVRAGSVAPAVALGRYEKARRGELIVAGPSAS